MTILAYFGPETVLPLATVVSAAVGFVLMVGKAPFHAAARVWRNIRRGPTSSSTSTPPRSARTVTSTRPVADPDPVVGEQHPLP